jgi:hypothetical protein
VADFIAVHRFFYRETTVFQEGPRVEGVRECLTGTVERVRQLAKLELVLGEEVHETCVREERLHLKVHEQGSLHACSPTGRNTQLHTWSGCGEAAGTAGLQDAGLHCRLAGCHTCIGHPRLAIPKHGTRDEILIPIKAVLMSDVVCWCVLVHP